MDDLQPRTSIGVSDCQRPCKGGTSDDAIAAPANVTLQLEEPAELNLCPTEIRSVLVDALRLNRQPIDLPASRIEEVILNASVIATLRSNGQLSGFGIYRLLDVPGEGWILYEYLVAVASPLQGQGWSRRLLEAVFDSVKASSGTPRWVGGRTGNPVIMKRYADLMQGDLLPLDRVPTAADQKAIRAIRQRVDQARDINEDWIWPGAYRSYGITGRFGQRPTLSNDRVSVWLDRLQSRGFRADAGDAVIVLATAADS